MLADHVEPKVLEHLQVVNHGLAIGWQVQAIGPVTLVKRTHEKDKFTVKERPLDAINHACREGSESSIASNLVIAHSYGDVVQVWVIGSPELRRTHAERNLLVSLAGLGGNIPALVINEIEFDVSAVVLGAVDGEFD
jgi:hypothetical protein